MAMAEPAPEEWGPWTSYAAVAMTRQADSIDKNVGTRLRVRRMTLGLSQTDIGAAIGVTFQQVQHYEKGVHRIGAGRLCRYLGGAGGPSAAAGGLPAKEPMEGLADSAGLRLAAAFTRITDRELRRRILCLVEELAGPE
jgi:transcriptional regulator with XRE-family HTH domain